MSGCSCQQPQTCSAPVQRGCEMLNKAGGWPGNLLCTDMTDGSAACQSMPCGDQRAFESRTTPWCSCRAALGN